MLMIFATFIDFLLALTALYTACAECMQMCILRINNSPANTDCCNTNILSIISFYIYFHILHLDINPFNKNPWLINNLDSTNCTDIVCNVYIMASIHNVEFQMWQSTVHKSQCDNPPAAGIPHIDIT